MEFGVLRKQPAPGISIRQYFYPNIYPFQTHVKEILYQSQAGEGPAAVLLLFSYLSTMMDFFI